MSSQEVAILVQSIARKQPSFSKKEETLLSQLFGLGDRTKNKHVEPKELKQISESFKRKGLNVSENDVLQVILLADKAKDRWENLFVNSLKLISPKIANFGHPGKSKSLRLLMCHNMTKRNWGSRLNWPSKRTIAIMTEWFPNMKWLWCPGKNCPRNRLTDVSK